MFARLSHIPFKYLILFLTGAAIVIFAITWLNQYFQNINEHYKIGIIVNSVEITPQDMSVFRFIVGKKLEEINAGGGIGGRPVKALYLDDKGDNRQLYKLVQESVKDKNLIAYIGCNRSSQIQTIRDIIGREKVPFIGGFALTQLVSKYPNIFTTQLGIKDVEVVFRNLLQTKATKIAFIGQSSDIYSEALLQIAENLAAEDPGIEVTLRKRFPLGHKFTRKEIRDLANSLKQNADFLILSVEPETNQVLLDGMWREGMKMPAFCGLTDMSQIDFRNPQYRANELYDINAFGIPDALNMRLEEHVAQLGKRFKHSNAFDFQIAFAGRHADEIGLLKEASLDRSLTPGAGIRDRINAGLSKYIHGRKIFRGLFTDWYFTPERSFGGETLSSWKPKGYPLPVLAPMQFMRTETGLEKEPRLPVLYADINLEELSHVNDEEGTFYANFYLELFSAKNINLDQVEFVNAARNKINHAPLVDIKLINRKKDSLNVMLFNHHYKVSGKFYFEPDLKRYPFDAQKFSIVMQPKNALQPFLVQPPEEDTRDTVFSSQGWIYHTNYVGYDQDIISVENTFDSLQVNIPYYKFSYVYEMKRARIDFNLKTLVPLLAILIITYFSAYIPPREFEALCAIQVTALLAAIALYFATFKPQMQYATISDIIFIFTYVMITSLIGTSILIYAIYRKSYTIKNLARLYQRVVFPVIVIAFTLYIRF